MALLDSDSEMQRAWNRRPFANGAEGETWMALWCEDGCVHLDDCPLLTVALLSARTPAAWVEREPGGLNRYTCTEYQDSAQATQEVPLLDSRATQQEAP